MYKYQKKYMSAVIASWEYSAVAYTRINDLIIFYVINIF